MPTWTRDGTVNVTSGSATVTGNSTLFTNMRIGNIFQVLGDAGIYEVISIVSDSNLILDRVYEGVTASAVSYQIIPTQGYVKQAADELNQLNYQLANGLPIEYGGTGASTAEDARTNLGVDTAISSAITTLSLEKVSISDYTPSDVLAKIKTVDGSGSGLDADMIDGHHADEFLFSNGTAVDSDKLGGFAASDYIRYAEVLGAMGNLTAPLTHLPLKKNLLTAQGESILTLTRASAATYKDRYGVLKSAAIDTPRFNEKGLMLEGTSTNLLLYSEQFDNSNWIKARSTISANTADTTDPYGTNFADKLIENTDNASHYVTNWLVYNSDTAYTSSIFLKAGGRTKARLTLPDVAFNGNNSIVVDLVSGTVTVASGSPLAYGIIKYANGWYRVYISATATQTTNRASGYVTLLDDSEASTYIGDGTSGLYIFGAQTEALPFITSYIPTTSSSTTRAADIMSLPWSDNVFDLSKDFTFMADVEIKRDSLFYLISGDVSSLDKFNVRFYQNILGIRWYNNITFTSEYELVDETKIRICLVKKGNQFIAYANGIEVYSTSLVNVSTNPTVAYIGVTSATSSNQFSAYLSNYKLYEYGFTEQEAGIA